MTGPLNELGDEIHAWAVNQGFYDGPIALPTHLMLIVSECAEALEEYRDGMSPKFIYHKDGKPEGVPVELADVLIRVLDTMTYHGIDIDQVVRQKIDYNHTRSRMNGGKIL